MHTHPLPSFLLPLQSVSLFLSPQPGLFTTISSRLKLHSYSAPGMPAAMQQSKQSVILYHLHPWECGNEEGKKVERKGGWVRGGMETGGQHAKGGDEKEKPLGLGGSKKGTVEGLPKERHWQQILLPHVGSFGPAETEARKETGRENRWRQREV